MLCGRHHLTMYTWTNLQSIRAYSRCWGRRLCGRHLTMYAWGRGEEGQIGSPPVSSSVARRLGSAENVVRVACGWLHSACVTDVGDLYLWGNPVATGQNGPSGALTRLQVFEDLRIKDVACGSDHTVALSGLLQRTELFTHGEWAGTGALVTRLKALNQLRDLWNHSQAGGSCRLRVEISTRLPLTRMGEFGIGDDCLRGTCSPCGATRRLMSSA
mmetsp:Transcript_30390/g.49117  ORF Transcript_30390/g.49117 Transcript_30390/m.49117 type:complete len:215 (+) Transcript_30390:114-758(+)